MLQFLLFAIASILVGLFVWLHLASDGESDILGEEDQ